MYFCSYMDKSKHIMECMKKIVNKKVWVLLIGSVFYASCSVGDDKIQDSFIDLYPSNMDYLNSGQKPSNNQTVSQGVFDGEWVIDGMVVATARLEVTNDSMKIILPEQAILQSSGVEALFPFGESDTTTTPVFNFPETTQIIKYKVVGLSREAGYATLYNGGSFCVTIDDVSYRVDLISEENGTAMYSITTHLWSLGIPVDKIAVTNLQTREQQTKVLSSPMMLIYNTKKKVG